MDRALHYIAFVAGLATVGWIGAGYVGSNALALIVTLMILAGYLAGALELHRFGQATDGLQRALAAIPQPLPNLATWLTLVPAGLQNAVRGRVEGERMGLPGPALTPYLAALLVLLGMLGTFLGMVVTLKGTGLALESATDLPAIRASLSAPVKGLGVAFGTSIAGIAASAMLGLMSALRRHQRARVGQLLETQIATTLRVHSRAHQRDETLRLMQQQAQVMPALVESLVDRLQGMITALESQGQAMQAQLTTAQAQFHSEAQAAYGALAQSVDRSLQTSLSESARIAGAAIQPVAEATMAGIAREAGALHTGLASHVQQQLDGLAQRFDASTAKTAALWQAAMAEQQHTTQALTQALRGQLDGFAHTFEQRSTALVDSVAQRLDGTATHLSETWREQLRQQQAAGEHLAQHTQHTLAAASAGFEQQAAALLRAVQQMHTELQDTLATRDAQRLGAWTASLSSLATSLQQHWQQLGAQGQAQQDQLQATLVQAEHAMRAASAGFEQQAAGLLGQLSHSHTTLQDTLVARDEQRLATWHQSLADIATALQAQWQHAQTQAQQQQVQICDTLASTAHTITTQAEAQSRHTIAEIQHLVQAASEAPRAAAEVMAELRQRLSDSLARDNTQLEERTHLLGTLSTLLDAVNHASTEQRSAIDALVASSAQLMQQVGERFTAQAHSATERLDAVAGQIIGSAVEVASLGEAFGHAVHLFTQTTDKLVTQLHGIEGALGQSLARSDDQLAYYVAQAREVIDLSISAQKQVLDELQRVARESKAATQAASA